MLSDWGYGPQDFGFEPDEGVGPAVETMPADVVRGQRFAGRSPGGRWAVCDWYATVCECVDMHASQPAGRPDCPRCGGTGSDGMEPDPLVDRVDRETARLLVFGPELIEAARDAVYLLRELRPAAVAALAKALADATGRDVP